MNYEIIHDNIINRSKLENRMKQNGVYYESHHIIPKCMGGSNKKDNLVLLTPKEHFIIHKLLNLIYPDNKSLFNSIWIMSHSKNLTIGCIEFERLRTIKIKIMKEDNPMKKMENREKFMGDKNPMKKMENREKFMGDKNTMFGKKRLDTIERNKTNNPMSIPGVKEKLYKPVIRIDVTTNEETRYDNTSLAAKDNSTSSRNISKYCLGTRNPRNKKYVWKYE